MNRVALLFPFLLLAGCNTPAQYKEKLTVVIPKDVMYNCPVIRKADLTSIETEADASRLLVKAVSNNWKCKQSLESIRKYLHDVKKRIES